MSGYVISINHNVLKILLISFFFIKKICLIINSEIILIHYKSSKVSYIRKIDSIQLNNRILVEIGATEIRWRTKTVLNK